MCSWLLTLIYCCPSTTSTRVGHKMPLPLHAFLKGKEQRGYRAEHRNTIKGCKYSWTRLQTSICMHWSSRILIGKGSRTTLKDVFNHQFPKICAFLIHGKTFGATTGSYLMQWDLGILTVVDIITEIK